MNYLRIIFTLLFIACTVSSQDSVLDNYPIGTDQVVQFKLDNRLKEISGLCVTKDGRLFAHNDERAAVYQLDYNSGKIVKSFFLGSLTIERDFEDIAFVDGVFYLITSRGILYRFREGDDGTNVDYDKTDLNISHKFDIEGLCFDPVNHTLLIAAKDYPGKKYDGYRAVYGFNLKNNKLEKKPVYLIDLKELRKKFDIKDFYPSAIAISPKGKSVIILSSRGKPCIVELSKKGELINALRLDDKVHRQPEGLTFLTDGVMLISDEAAGRKPKLSKYFPLKYK